MSKRNRETPDNSTLLVLGAGASIGAAKYPVESSWRDSLSRMPSGDNFFHDLFFQGRTHTHSERQLNMLGLTYEGVNDLIVRAWGMEKNLQRFDPDEWRQVNVEEVFTFLDIGARMYPRGTQYQRAFAICRESLADFITTMLSMKSDGLHCEHLRDILFDLDETDSIISFNWDTIADFTLQLVRLPIYKGYVDLMTADPLRPRDFRDRAVLLKLHGSLNWLMCPNSKCPLSREPRLAVRRRQLERFLDICRCPACGSDGQRPFIVPPTSQKLIRRGTLLHKLWMIALDKLPSCGRLLFIGYSFPATDFYSEWLFRQIRFLDGPPPQVIVVNPEIMKKRSRVSQRYEKIFRGCDIHRFPGIEDFRRDGRHLLRDA